MTTSLSGLIAEMNARPLPKIQLMWECLPALDGSVHAVEPDPDASFQNEYGVSLCGRALVLRDWFVLDSGMCPICKAVSLERQAEFDGV